MEKIIFTDVKNSVLEEYYPKPASAFVPEWYKKMDSYLTQKKIPNGDGNTSGTIKKCMPVFDAITAGYIIVLPADVYVTQKVSEFDETETYPWFEWPSFDLVSFHVVEQAPNHPQKGEHNSYPKWINPWAIKTPKGYSTLFTQPVHRKSPFTILDAIVDTDTYTAPVNFPFVLNNYSFEGLIPAGTPIAQVIPFERKDWQMEIGTKKDFQEQSKTTARLRTKILDSYKIQFRQRKEYK